jgi:hypothetical protein
VAGHCRTLRVELSPIHQHVTQAYIPLVLRRFSDELTLTICGPEGPVCLRRATVNPYAKS